VRTLSVAFVSVDTLKSFFQMSLGGRGDFKKKRVDVQAVKTESLFDIGEADVESELSSIKKIRARIEKNNERLLEQENSLLEQVEAWQREIENLV
jgi:hypothetical protein